MSCSPTILLAQLGASLAFGLALAGFAFLAWLLDRYAHELERRDASSATIRLFRTGALVALFLDITIFSTVSVVHAQEVLQPCVAQIGTLLSEPLSRMFTNKAGRKEADPPPAGPVGGDKNSIANLLEQLV